MANDFPCPLKFALFDFDGVISDTESLYIELDKKTLTSFGYTPSLQELQWLVGKPSDIVCPNILKKHGIYITPDEYRHARDVSNAIYRNPNLHPNAWLKNLWCMLSENGVKIGVVSTTQSADLVWALDHFNLLGLVDVLVGREFVEHCKPSPEAYLRALQFLLPNNSRAAAAHAIAVEDSTTGIASSVAAGIYTIAYTGSSYGQDISEAHSTTSSFQELGNQLLVSLNRTRSE